MLRVDRVTKRFGDQVAVNAVSFEAQAGEVVAVLGENGAGKSTLLSCISGFVAPDSGAVWVDGVRLSEGEPQAALRRGVGTAFQHFSLVPTFTVEESLALAGLPESRWADHLSGRIAANGRIEDLAVAERQQVEFLKARLTGPKVLLLDEPTSPLGDINVQRVLDDIVLAGEDGAAILFVTHRLREALAVADRILVMRHGFLVGTWSGSEGEWESGIEDELIAAMFGSVVPVAEELSASAEALPSVGVIAITDRLVGRRIEVRRGRLLAIVGIGGNGQQRLAQLLAGDIAARIEVHGTDGTVKIHQAEWLRHHATVIPEDRVGEGGAPEMSVGETLILRDLVQGRLQSAGWTSRRSLRKRAAAMIANWRISPARPGARFGNLSGGNMQRVVLARALDPEPELLVAMNPTQGLDVATAESVRERLLQTARNGTAVVSIEQDVDDAMRYADEVAMLFQGAISRTMPVAEADRQRLQLMMVAGW